MINPSTNSHNNILVKSLHRLKNSERSANDRMLPDCRRRRCHCFGRASFSTNGRIKAVANAQDNSNNESDDDNDDNDSKTDTTTTTTIAGGLFVLPIFPLRKRVRFPTDWIAMNLYEKRYLAMCDYILRTNKINIAKTVAVDDRSSSSSFQQQPHIFGALYTSDKPQIVPQSTGPIVPMLSKGDIGTIFVVTNHVEMHNGASIATTRSVAAAATNKQIQNNKDEIQHVGGDGRGISSTTSYNNNQDDRRIRLEAIGVGRFRIERIIYDGTGTNAGSTHRVDDPNDNIPTSTTPFILVEASAVHDDKEDAGMNTVGRSRVDDAIQIPFEKDFERIFGVVNSFEIDQKLQQFEILNSKHKVTHSNSNCCQQRSSTTQSNFVSWLSFLWHSTVCCDTDDDHSSERYELELLSFLAASSWMNSNNNNNGNGIDGNRRIVGSSFPSDMVSILKTTSTKQRLEWIQKTYCK